MPGHVNEDLWNKAKSKVKHEDYPNDDSYWKVVTSIYEKMGGTFSHKSEHKSKYEGIIKKSDDNSKDIMIDTAMRILQLDFGDRDYLEDIYQQGWRDGKYGEDATIL